MRTMLPSPRNRSSRATIPSSKFGRLLIGRLLICLGLALGMAPGCSAKKKAKKKSAWTGKGSFRCDRDERITLRKLTVVANQKISIDAHGQCKLELVDCNLKGSVRVAAHDRARITITGGRLETRDTAVWASDLAEIRMTGVWVMGGEPQARGTGLRVDGESHLVVVGSHLQGGRNGLRANGKSRIELSDTKVTGAYGITARRQSRVTISGGTVEGSRYAILTNDAARVTHHGTRVTGRVVSKGRSKVIERKVTRGKVTEPALPSVMK